MGDQDASSPPHLISSCEGRLTGLTQWGDGYHTAQISPAPSIATGSSILWAGSYTMKLSQESSVSMTYFGPQDILRTATGQ